MLLICGIMGTLCGCFGVSNADSSFVQCDVLLWWFCVVSVVCGGGGATRFHGAAAVIGWVSQRACSDRILLLSTLFRSLFYQAS